MASLSFPIARTCRSSWLKSLSGHPAVKARRQPWSKQTSQMAKAHDEFKVHRMDMSPTLGIWSGLFTDTAKADRAGLRVTSEPVHHMASFRVTLPSLEL